MRSLLLSEIFPPHVGGSGRWFWEIYRRLPADEYTIVAGEHPEQEAFDSQHAFDINRLPLKMRQWGVRSWEGLCGYTGAVRALRKLARKRNVEIIHCGRCLPEGVMALALKWSLGLPYLCYVHGEDVGTAVNSREHRMLVRRVLKGAKCCIANSENSARLLREQWNVPAARIHVLNPGVDTSYFVPGERDLAARQRLGWHDQSVVLTVGRLQQRKGHDMLIRALPAIRQQVPHVLYAIVGEGEELGSLRKLAGELGVEEHVQFLGNLGDADLLRCYQQCDLFALPNREINGDIEGFGMVLVEAQACGKPVLAGRSGGTAETMKVGTTGEIVPCDSPTPLADAVSRLLLNEALRDQMGRRARDHVVAQFDWDELALQARELFQSHFSATHKRDRALTGASV